MLLPCVVELIDLLCFTELVSLSVSMCPRTSVPYLYPEVFYVGAKTQDSDGQQCQQHFSHAIATPGQGCEGMVKEVQGVHNSE